MKKIDKYEIFHTLLRNNEDAYLVMQKHPEYNYRFVKLALNSDEYKYFKELRLKTFYENIDLSIIQKLFTIDNTLEFLDPESHNYPALIKEYGNLIKLTETIAKRLNKTSKDININESLNKLELTIDDYSEED